MPPEKPVRVIYLVNPPTSFEDLGQTYWRIEERRKRFRYRRIIRFARIQLKRRQSWIYLVATHPVTTTLVNLFRN